MSFLAAERLNVYRKENLDKILQFSCKLVLTLLFDASENLEESIV